MDKRTTAYLFALLIFAVDQISKWYIIGPLNLEAVQNIQLLPFFDFTWVENRGISLGIAQAQNETHRWILVAVTAAIAVGVAVWIRKEEARGDQLALAMVLGGALGNIVDRTRYGYVVDFLDLHFGTFRPFYVFNVGDAAISIGVVILLLRAFLIRDKAPEGMNEHA
ncbi:signal peptidase II [Sphingomonas sp. NSE70-1]|uniref:Lipoprotein signal peptidase n=1 Tax=Sphingomonas caseinilyticus TaxID=2908205 RepID=A0ABT0RX76_9SPHN|nr:signal peptidase II [Sphingomonas caseinilyticus]MCL6699315.1 signal peptidase II [Sphingomonas caseinilyticus]